MSESLFCGGLEHSARDSGYPGGLTGIGDHLPEAGSVENAVLDERPDDKNGRSLKFESVGFGDVAFEKGDDSPSRLSRSRLSRVTSTPDAMTA